MKKHHLSGVALVVVLALGCQEGKSPPGGPGATGTTQRNTGIQVRQPDNTFQLDVPNLQTTIKQGETKTVAIGISRGTNFDQDVKLEFSEAPKGLKVTAADSAIKSGDKQVQVKIEAAADASLGEHMITVTGTPAKEGAKTSAQFKIEVKKSS